METNTSNNRYEIAYHLTPDLDEAGVALEVKNLNDFLVQQGADVNSSADPKRKHLSYPINKKHYSYFGYIEFSAPQEAIKSINGHLKLQPQFFRHVVIRKPDTKELRVLGIAKSSRYQQSVAPSMTTVTPKPEPKIKTPEQEKQMTQDLDEVLENL